MPELPEVETIRRDLQHFLLRQKIAKVEVRTKKLVPGSARTFIKKLTGQSITAIDRRGKLLVFSFKTPDLHLLIHLKMTGQLIYTRNNTFIAGGHPIPLPEKLPNKHTHIILHFADGGTLYFNDLRQFGYAKLVDQQTKESILATYGIEPLTPNFTYPAFRAILKKRSAPLKQVLLNQTLIAGLGNIYVDESCFFAGVRPTRRAKSLTEAEMKKLFRACTHIMRQAIKHRGTTFGAYRDGVGARGKYVDKLKTYGRAGLVCLRCGQGPIKKTTIAGRGTTYCASCQK